MKVLSFGIPEIVWEQSLKDEKFEIDWKLLRATYKLDAFEKGTKQAVAGKAKQWLKKTDDRKLAKLRTQYSSLRFGGNVKFA